MQTTTYMVRRDVRINKCYVCFAAEGKDISTANFAFFMEPLLDGAQRRQACAKGEAARITVNSVRFLSPSSLSRFLLAWQHIVQRLCCKFAMNI